MQPDLNGCCTMLLKSQANSYNFIVMVQNHLKTRKLIIKSYIKPVKIKWNSCFYFRFYVSKRNTCCKTKRCQLPSILRTLSLQSSRPSSISSPPYMLINLPTRLNQWPLHPFSPMFFSASTDRFLLLFGLFLLPHLFKSQVVRTPSN